MLMTLGGFWHAGNTKGQLMLMMLGGFWHVGRERGQLMLTMFSRFFRVGPAEMAKASAGPANADDVRLLAALAGVHGSCLLLQKTHGRTLLAAGGEECFTIHLGCSQGRALNL